MKYRKLKCPICGYFIGNNNYSRHIAICDGTYIPKELKSPVYRVDHDGLNCKFCNKLCHNLNSLTQHELRCSKNPDKLKNNFAEYIKENRKGKTKYNCDDAMKQSETLRKKYLDGYISPFKGRTFTFEHVYDDHNNREIGKWLTYVDSIYVEIPDYTLTNTRDDDYNRISSKCIESLNGNCVLEHVYIANLYLSGGISKGNIVHHIDRNIKNNDIHNLLVFETNQDHKRFHFSKFSKLIYNEKTHLFSCVIEK